MKKPIKKTPGVSIIVLVGIGCLMLGLAVSLVASNVTRDDVRLASIEEKAQAETDITNKFLSLSSAECNDPTGQTSVEDRVAVFKKYLKVNGYANRAVIRGCSDIDTLLYKDKTGEWIAAKVNVSLDRRANPKWQKECLIQDITRADTVERPENRSIDTLNYEWCKELPK